MKNSARAIEEKRQALYITQMSSKYSVAEARANLPKILDEVELGREVELTRRGKRIAVVLSAEEYERLSGGYRDFSEVYDAHRARYEGLERATLEAVAARKASRRAGSVLEGGGPGCVSNLVV